MKSIYIYPNINIKNTIAQNPYIKNLINSLCRYNIIINKNVFSDSGILNFLRKNDYDFLFLNWIENLPDRKFGIFQSIIFLIYLYTKSKNIKIIWTVHNKISHTKKYFLIKKVIFKCLARKSSLIITHATDGVNYVKTFNEKANIYYFPHPTVPHNFVTFQENKFDILMWGSIAPYKKIHQFLINLYKRKLENKYRILINGKINNFRYSNYLRQFENNNISIIDDFVNEQRLDEILSVSRLTLFTYGCDSLLSSGCINGQPFKGNKNTWPPLWSIYGFAKRKPFNYLYRF